MDLWSYPPCTSPIPARFGEVVRSERAGAAVTDVRNVVSIGVARTPEEEEMESDCSAVWGIVEPAELTIQAARIEIK